jgi:hypothetical protein
LTSGRIRADVALADGRYDSVARADGSDRDVECWDA